MLVWVCGLGDGGGSDGVVSIRLQNAFKHTPFSQWYMVDTFVRFNIVFNLV